MKVCFTMRLKKNTMLILKPTMQKSGADYAVWWLKKNRPALPKVWSKTIKVN